MKKINTLLISLIIVFLFGCVALAATPSGSASVGNGGGSAGGGQTGSVSGQSGNGKGGTRTRYVYCWEDEDGMIHEFPGTYHLCQGAYTGMLSTTGTAPRTYEGTKHVQSRITNKLKDVTTVWGEKWGGEGIIANKKGATAYFDNENTAIWVWKTSKSGRYCGNGYPLGNGVKTPNSQITITENDSIRLLSDIKARATSKGDTSTLEIIEKIEKEEIVSHIKIYAEVRDGNGWGTSDDRAWEIVRKELYCVKPYYIEKEIAQGKISSSDGGAVYLGWDYVPGTANTLGNIKQSWKTLDDENIVEPIVTKMEKDEKYTKSINDAEIPEEYVHVKTTLKKFDKETSEESEIDYDPQEIIGDPEVGYEIVYWYSVGTEVEETWVTTTGDIIEGPISYVFKEGEEKHTFTRYDKTIDEKIYTYVETKVDGEKKPDEPVIISNDDKPHKIIYVYEKKSTLVVYHKIEGTDKTIATIGPIVVRIGDNVGPYYPKTANELTSLGYEDAEYTGVEELKDDKVIKSKSKKSEVKVQIEEEGKYEVIFWYKPSDKEKLHIRVDYVCKKDGFIANSDEWSRDIEGNYKVPITIKTIDDKHKYKDYSYKISNNPIPYPFSGTTGTGTPNIEVEYNGGGNKYVRVVLYYECPEEENEDLGKIHHIYINPFNTSERTELLSEKREAYQTFWYYKYYMHNNVDGSDKYLGDDRQGEGGGNKIYNFVYPKYPDDFPKDSSGEVSGDIKKEMIYHDYYHLTFYSNTDLGNGNIIANEPAYLLYDKYGDGTNEFVKENTSFRSLYCHNPVNASNRVDKIADKSKFEGYIFYTDQIINYKHILVGTSYEEEGEVKKLGAGREIVEVHGGYFVDRYPDKDYLLIGIKLNNEWIKKDKILSDAGWQVDLKEGEAEQNIVFYYKKAPGETKGLPVVCYPDIDRDTVELDESFIVTIPNNGEHIKALEQGYTTPVDEKLFDADQEWNSYFAAAKYIQFSEGLDVEYNGTIYPGGTPIKLAERSSKLEAPKYAPLPTSFEFTVPVWVKDKETYSARIWVTPAGPHNQSYDNVNWNELDEYASGYATSAITIKVMGKIYDFTVTNIQGDDMWKKMLLLPSTNDVNGEYKSPGVSISGKDLPIGQETQRTNKKYNYAIKKGTKFYFSVNTKGISNEAIKIVPKFYYISRDGAIRKEVNVFTKNGKGVYEKINSPRISNTKNSNKLTREFGLEKQKAVTLYNEVKFDVNASIGDYNNIKLNDSFKFPYLNYLKAEGERWNGKKDESTILKAVSHWYGDYLIPSDAKFADKDTANPTELDFKKYNDGYVVVLFKIESQTSNDTYLKYDTVWDEEEGMFYDYIRDIQLPRIEATGNLPIMGDGAANMLKSGYAPVIIYQANISTNQNYDTTGTH